MGENDRKVIPLPGLHERYVNTGVIHNHYMKELDRIKSALQDEEGDPYIKSILLKDLKENQLNVTVQVHKFGRDISVDIENMKDVTEDEFFVGVESRLTEVLESDNPTLYEMAMQLWKHFMVTMFPLDVEPKVMNLWAAAVYKLVHDMNGMNVSSREAAQSFQVDEEEIIKAAEKIEKVERATTV